MLNDFDVSRVPMRAYYCDCCGLGLAGSFFVIDVMFHSANKGGVRPNTTYGYGPGEFAADMHVGYTVDGPHLYVCLLGLHS